MPAFSEYFVHNATPAPSSLSSSSKSGFGHYCRFNSNVAYAHYCCNPFGSAGGLQQHRALFADHFPGTFIPMNNIWPYCHYHYSMNPKRSFCQQQVAAQCWPADTTFFTISQVPGTSTYVAQPSLDKQRDTSPFSSGISRSSSTASSDYADSTSSGIGSQDSYHQQEESGSLPGDNSRHLQITSLGDSVSENWSHNNASGCDYDFARAGLYSQKQQPQSQQIPKYSMQSTGLLAQTSSDVLVTAYSTCCPSAMKLYNLRKRHLARKGRGSSTGNLRFGTGAGFESIITPAATCFHVYQSPNRFLIPLEAVETYIHCLESFSTQLVQSQITSTQAHLVPEFETARFISDLSARAKNTTNVTAETLSECDNIRTGGENVSSISREIDSGTPSIPGNALDENDYPTLSAKPKKIVQDHFLDEDSLLENLPKFEHCSGSGLPCELTRNSNWLQSKSPNAKLDFEIYGNDGYVSRQRKQILQARNIHRNTGITTCGANEGRSGGLPPMPLHHQLNDNNWRRHSQNVPLSKNCPARPFSTSDGFVRSRERNGYDKFYMDRSRDRSQCNSSDRRSTPRMANIYRSVNRSSFISHDKSGLSYHDGNTENSLNFVTSDDKRDRGIATSDCSLHRNVKRNGSNRSRNSPPVYLALKSHHEFVDIDSTEVETIGSTAKEERLEQSHSPKRSVESTQKTAQDVEQLTGLFCERVAVCGGGEISYQSDSSSAAIGACDRIFVEDKKIIEKSISPAGSITEELPQQDIVPTADARLDFSSEASTPVQGPPESNVIDNGGFELSKLDVLSEEIWYYHKAITQTEGVLNRKLHLRDVLYYAISPVFPMCGLYVVGSSLNGFGTNSSDMDLCLMITNKDLDQRTDAVVVLNMIQSALAETKWVSHMQLILAKVPILRIRFYEPFTDITVDLNANNSVAIRNTHLLCYYSSFDWRVRPLVSVVKEWAKRRDINDANRSSFTSYSLVLMVIHYLQCGLKQPVLPSLQVVYPKRFSASADVRSLNVSSHLEPPPGWVTNETITLGELLIGFLEYYAFKFDYLKDAISVRLGSKTERTVVARQPSPYNSNIAQWNCICIEEPFTLSNTAHSVHNQMVFDAIRQAFIDGCYELDGNRDLKAFLDVGPINVSVGSSVGSSAQLSILAQSEAGSPTTSSGDVTLMSKHLLTISPQSNKQEYELVEGDESLPLNAESEMELETAVAVPLDERICVEQNTSQRNSLASYENEVADIASDGETPISTIDFIENVLPTGAEPDTTPSVFVDDQITPTSNEQISKTILSERQPKQLQMKSRSEKLHVDSVGSFEILTKQDSMVEQEQFAGKVIIQRRRKANRRMHGSMGCTGRNHLNKSNLGQSVVRMSYRSGTASS